MDTNIVFELPTEEQKALVRQLVGTSKEDIRQAVANIRNWLQAQPHLPHVIEDDRLERMYICCKCSTENVKKLLDAYYTLKTKFPELLMNRDPLAGDVQQMLKHVKMTTMPRLTKDFHRVGIITEIDEDATKWNMTTITKAALLAVEFILSYDYSIGYIFLVDLKNFSAAHVARMTVHDIRALEIIARRAYSKRVIAIHFVNAPKVVDMLLSIVKPALPEKLQKRVVTHLPGSQTLFDHVPKDMVPDEMGGTAGPMDKLMDAIGEHLIALRDWYQEQDKYVTDESKRPPGSDHDYDMFGVDGSFKKLQVD